VTQVLVAATARPPEPEYHLTERERELLGLLVKGLSNPEIANRLTISLSTVKFHISSILAKLGASSRTAAVAMALENTWSIDQPSTGQRYDKKSLRIADSVAPRFLLT